MFDNHWKVSTACMTVTDLFPVNNNGKDLLV